MTAFRWFTRIATVWIVLVALLWSATQTLAPATSSLNAGHSRTSFAQPEIQQPAPPPLQQGKLTRNTGIDMQPCTDFGVCGTDLGIPFVLPNNSIGYLFGDTFVVAGPHIPNLPPGSDEWRSPVMLRSNLTPVEGQPIIFDSAAGLADKGIAPEFMLNMHRSSGEISILPNDAISFPETGDIVVSFMSIGEGMTKDNPHWRTNYAGLAISHDGNTFERIAATPGAPIWSNDANNSDPFQMWSMQRDGDYVYIVTVRAGRQTGPMMLLRVPWNKMLDKGSYVCWNGENWGGTCKPILPESKYGEPSLRKLSDGTWVLSYVDFTYTQLVTRTANNPEGPWSQTKIQLTWKQLNALYGGFIHPRSTRSNLIMMISVWQAKTHDPDTEEDDELIRYDVSHLVGEA